MTTSSRSRWKILLLAPGILKPIAYKVYTVLKLRLFHNFLRDGKSLLESNAAIYWTLAGLSAATFAAIVINIIWASAGMEEKLADSMVRRHRTVFVTAASRNFRAGKSPLSEYFFLYLVYLCVTLAVAPETKRHHAEFSDNFRIDFFCI